MAQVRPSVKLALLGALLLLLAHTYAQRQSPPVTADRQPALGELAAVDAEDHIRITRYEEALTVRSLVAEYLWPIGGAVPTHAYPVVLMEGEGDLFFPSDLEGIAPRFVGMVTLLEYWMPGGALNLMYQLEPRKLRSSRLPVIVHQGHRPGLRDGIDEMTNALLRKGHPVILMQMPLVGWNRWSLSPGADCGSGWAASATGHDQMFARKDALHSSPMSYFIEPVVAAVNHLTVNFAVEYVAMVGLSGGGWTTHIVAAIDPRVSYSFPVAGSYPLYLRPYFRGSDGDAEQIVPALYENRATWLDLYLLSALEPGRTQHQILNLHDPCCFHGRGGEHYAHVVEARLQIVGEGSWKWLLDSTHRQHMISPWARKHILRQLQ